MNTNISVVLLLPSLPNYTSYSVTISTCVTCDSHLSQASEGPPTPWTGPLTSSSPRLWPPGSRSVATAATSSHQRIVLRLESFLLLQNCLLNQSFSFLITVSVSSRTIQLIKSFYIWNIVPIFISLASQVILPILNLLLPSFLLLLYSLLLGLDSIYVISRRRK